MEILKAVLPVSKSRGDIFSFISFLLFLVLAVTLPFTQKIAADIIGLSVAFMLLSGQLFKSWKFILNHKIIFLFTGWYVLHLTGLLYSEDIHYGLKDLETKLSFLFVPFIIFSSGITKAQVKFIFHGFVTGCTLACIACLLKAIGWYNYDGELKHFVYMSFSYLLHPTYFSFYLNFAIIFLLTVINENWSTMKLFVKVLLIFLCCFLLFNITLLNARTATATAYLTIFIYLVYLFVKHKVYFQGIFVVVILLAVFGYAQYKVLHVSEGRLQQMTSIINQTTNTQEYNSTTVRIHLWKSAWELICEHPLFGVGIGDIKEELVKKYIKNNFQPGITNHYSPHNQYFHTAVILGFTGLLYLLVMLVYPFFLSFKRRNWIFFYLLFIILFNNITESLMEVEKGIFFFTFFNALCFYLLSLEEKSAIEVGIRKQ